MLVLTSRQVALPAANSLAPATLEIDEVKGIILAVHKRYSSKADYPNIREEQFVDYGDLYLLPGIVDSHVHLNEPGRTEWEGFETGTKAAIIGGVTTLCDMPLNAIPPTTTVENLHIKREASKGKCRTDVAFWGGVIPGNAEDLLPLVAEGVKGFKCFLVDSGVSEFPHVLEADLHLALEQLKSAKVPLLYHAELDPENISSLVDLTLPKAAFSTFLQSRPDKLETSAIDLIARLQRQYTTVPMHIVHLSAAGALPTIRAVRAEKLPLTVETCHHYLCLTAEDVPDGRTDFKCCPPIRGKSNREQLWQALLDGEIDCVVSDHSPCVAELKRLETGDFSQAWGGIGSLGLGLSLLHTEASARGIHICRLVKWMCENTALQLGLQERKGSLQAGRDADLLVFDPNDAFTVDETHLNFKNKVTPYLGKQLHGRVQATFLRGKLAYKLHAGVSETVEGQLL